jgi:DNA-binding transcriptional ArsR family regulator
MKPKHVKHISLSPAFKALGNEIRLKIFIEVLEEACECDLKADEITTGNCVSHIADKLKIPQPTVSNHIKKLEEVGLISSHKIGTNIYLFGTEASAKAFQDFGNFLIDEVYGHDH